MRWLAALAVVACSSGKDPGGGSGSGSAPTPPSAGDHMTGTLAIDGTAVAMTVCRPGSDKTIFVEVATPKGSLHFQDRSIAWIVDGARQNLACDPLPTNKAIWGGGVRGDGTVYFRGELKFTCKGAIGVVDGDLNLECGRITADERTKLDANRTHEPATP
jgi:hypothetical protein